MRPEPLRTRQALLPALMSVYLAYKDLEADRPWISGGLAGATPRALPWSQRDRYLTSRGYRGARRDFAEFCLGVLDRTFLEHWQSRMAAAAENEPDPDPST